MSESIEVRLASGKFGDGDGGLYTEGDTFDVPEAAVAEHPQLDPVSGDEAGGSSGDEQFDAEAFVRDGNATDVQQAIRDGQADGQRYDVVREAEAEYRDRSTVYDALDSRTQDAETED